MSFMWSLVFKMPLKLKNGHFVCLILTDFISGENPSCNHCIAVQKRVWVFYLLQVLVWIVCPCHAVDRVAFTYLQLKALVLRFPFTCFCCSTFFACVKSIFVFRLELLVCIPRLLPRSSTVTWLVSVWCFWSSSSDFVAPCLWRWKPQARKNSLRKILSCVV